MTPLEQAKIAARALSQRQCHGLDTWCVERTALQTFENREEVGQIERLKMIAVAGGLGLLRLSLEALSVLAAFDPQE